MAGRGNKPLEIRLDEARRALWDEAARDAGYSTSEYVRAAVDDRIATDAGKPRKKTAKGKAAPVARTSMCEHRLPPSTYCPRCDPRPT